MQNPEVGPRVEEIESGESQDQREDIEGQEKLEQANDFVVVNNLVEQIDQRHENMDSQTKSELQQNFKEVMDIDREKGEMFLGWFAELDIQPKMICPSKILFSKFDKSTQNKYTGHNDKFD
ncbi:hypothetical protein [Candidatus Absconditicoccus praedator]|uniref:hypothetical protein n=1 Tax=Candidatus Absconditicoccus praedator TaxID=2735562 RepID=UPI001E4DB4CA|nr:hypothetical protein [Candidatus Absconditicoccus praedator]UFX83122.1 hypothetical protein HLG78_03235 [Candidatus Absconditicoccus praedator]